MIGRDVTRLGEAMAEMASPLRAQVAAAHATAARLDGYGPDAKVWAQVVAARLRGAMVAAAHEGDRGRPLTWRLPLEPPPGTRVRDGTGEVWTRDGDGWWVRPGRRGGRLCWAGLLAAAGRLTLVPDDAGTVGRG